GRCLVQLLRTLLDLIGGGGRRWGRCPRAPPPGKATGTGARARVRIRNDRVGHALQLLLLGLILILGGGLVDVKPADCLVALTLEPLLVTSTDVELALVNRVLQ